MNRAAVRAAVIGLSECYEAAQSMPTMALKAQIMESAVIASFKLMLQAELDVGRKLVPREPTEDMLAAYAKRFEDGHDDEWETMWDAAPSSPK